MKWSQVEKRLRELIKDNRYLNPKEKDHYADYLESVSAPQYEVDTQRKIARQRFIDAHRDLPPADKRDTLALRLSDFICDLDRYEKDLLSVVGRSDLADITAEQMEQQLSDPSTVQQLIDFLAQVQWKTTSVFSRSNGWKFTEELRELHPLRYLYNEGDVVYIGADKYEIATLTEEKVYLQNAEFPILGQEYSRADFEEKLTENPANDHLKVVVTEKQRTETPSEKKQDGIQFSIGFSEHPAFYDRQLNDRYTDLSFALGNKLLGILDEKQHREREGDKNIGWYHKTDFVIKAVIGGEEFNYEGRFDIGDGEGDLIAHIKNFYDYALSPKGEQLYGDDRESLLRGRDEFIPFLEQHTELTQEDEKLLDEIMATESDWYRTAEEAEEKPQAYADIMNGSEAPAIEMEQSADDLIGREIIIDNRKYLIENIGKISGDVSLRDITFQNNVGFPINRVEKIGYIQKLLEQEKTELPLKEKTEAPAADRHNFRITDDAIGVGGAKEKFRNNMAAINLLHELEIENRLATPEEQEVLSRYVGWGGLSMAFDEHNAAWSEEFKELYASLSPEEYRAAMESTLTAFYTPPVVIKAMYDALDRLGFSQGNILEPSCGTGNFFGLLPESMQNSKLHGVEIDSLTGRLAKQLYQKANIAIEGFEKTNLPDDHFDVVLGNVPFGEIRVNDSRYNAQKFLIHDYFFAKALDKVRAGGVVMFITSKGTMDKASPEVRKYIAQRAELLGAIRLPDNTFKANAGTEVTSDILILQKRDRVMDIEPDWVHLDTDENGVTMNRYFVEHPEMVLGEIKMESTRFGTFEPVCKAHKDIPLSELLSNAVQRINGEIPELDNGVDEISDEQELSVPADPNVRNFSFTLVDGRVYFRENNRMHPASVSMTAENRIKGLIQIRDCVRKLIEYQTEDYPEEMICTEQENLNRLYDAYTAKYGLINSRGNYLAFASDESYFLLCSLEVLDDEGNFKRKADMFTKRTIKPHREITSVETASEALALSIGEKDCKFPGELARILHGDQHGILALPEIAPAAHPGGGVGAPCVIGKPLVPAFVDQRYDIPCPGMQQPAALLGPGSRHHAQQQRVYVCIPGPHHIRVTDGLHPALGSVAALKAHGGNVPDLVRLKGQRLGKGVLPEPWIAACQHVPHPGAVLPQPQRRFHRLGHLIEVLRKLRNRQPSPVDRDHGTHQAAHYDQDQQPVGRGQQRPPPAGNVPALTQHLPLPGQLQSVPAVAVAPVQPPQPHHGNQQRHAAYQRQSRVGKGLTPLRPPPVGLFHRQTQQPLSRRGPPQVQQHRLHRQHQQQCAYGVEQGEPLLAERYVPCQHCQRRRAGAQGQVQIPRQEPPPGTWLLPVCLGRGGSRLGRRVQGQPVFLRVQAVIADPVRLHGPAYGLVPPGLLLPALGYPDALL